MGFSFSSSELSSELDASFFAGVFFAGAITKDIIRKISSLTPIGTKLYISKGSSDKLSGY